MEGHADRSPAAGLCVAWRQPRDARWIPVRWRRHWNRAIVCSPPQGPCFNSLAGSNAQPARSGTVTHWWHPSQREFARRARTASGI